MRQACLLGLRKLYVAIIMSKFTGSGVASGELVNFHAFLGKPVRVLVTSNMGVILTHR
jgi:hypothetical protein